MLIFKQLNIKNVLLVFSCIFNFSTRQVRAQRDCTLPPSVEIYGYGFKEGLGVCFFVCPIITQEPLN